MVTGYTYFPTDNKTTTDRTILVIARYSSLVTGYTYTTIHLPLSLSPLLLCSACWFEVVRRTLRTTIALIHLSTIPLLNFTLPGRGVLRPATLDGAGLTEPERALGQETSG